MDESESKGRSGPLARAIVSPCAPFYLKKADSPLKTALLPFHAAVSKPAQRAYLGTFLFAAASVLLVCVSSVAYALFYYNYVPQNSVERVVHLQFGQGHPHGTAHLAASLTSLQPYDITLTLHLPRTPSNLAVGNFMLDLSLLGPAPPSSSSSSSSSSSIVPPSLSSATNNTTTTPPLAHSRRPAILTYTSPFVETANTLSGLPWYMTGWKSESEVLSVRMFDGVEFPREKKSGGVPQRARVTVEADGKMQFYGVRLDVVARLRGLRWAMYHHRVLSFFFFTAAFWSSAVVSMALAWFTLSTYLGTSSSTSSSAAIKAKAESEEEEEETDDGAAVKREREDEDPLDPITSLDDLSDTARTFPTLGRQMPLRFPGRKDVKREAEIKREEDEVMRSSSLQPFAAEADDEEEDDDDVSQQTSLFRDSGIGTSLDDERLASVQRRRKAVMNRRDGGN